MSPFGLFVMQQPAATLSHGEGGKSPAGVAGEPATELDSEVISLYSDHAAVLWRYARTLASDEQAVSDAVQETFLRYMIVRRGGKSIDNPSAWLFRVLHNLLLDWSKQATAISESEIGGADLARDWRQDPEQACRQAELIQKFGTRLSVRELTCLRLRLAGLRHREIAEVMDIAVGTVGSMLFRIQAKAKELVLATADYHVGSTQSRTAAAS